jgi:hypothetical protein
LVKPRLASARDKLALTDSRLKLNSPLKLLGTFKPGKPSILVLGLIFFVIGAVFWFKIEFVSQPLHHCTTVMDNLECQKLN